MFKRILSLIIIFAAVSSLVYIFFANNLLSGLFFQQKNAYVLDCAHAVDRSGNIYFVRKDQSQAYLISLDSTGRQSYKRDITGIVGEDCVFDSLFIDQDKSLMLTAYKLVPNSPKIEQVGIYMFRDDGSFVMQIFKNKLEQMIYDSKFRIISAMSDDNKNIYFGLLTGTAADVFAFEKGSKALAKKINEYRIPDIAEKINTFCVLPSGEAIFSLEGGSLLKKSQNNGDTAYKFNEKAIIDHIWFAGNQFYCRDAVSGSIYMSSILKLELSAAIKGSKSISDNEGLQFSRLNHVAVGNVGNVLGILDDNRVKRIFLGGFAFLPEIGKTDAAAKRSLSQWFLLAGVAVGTVVLSLLIWDFYCSFMNMRLSILFRQAFLVILVIFLALYFLTSYIIVPNSQEMLGRVHKLDQIKASQMFIAAFKGVRDTSAGRELEANQAASFFEQFRKNLSSYINTAGAEAKDSEGSSAYEMLNTAHISLVVKSGGQDIIAASNDRYEKGYPTALQGYGTSYSEGIEKAEKDEVASFEVITQRGRELCVLMPTGLRLSGSPVILSMIVGLDVLEKNTSDMISKVTWFMRLVGLVLVLLVMIVEYFTVYNVRKLKKGVDKIAAGDYGRDIKVYSGDEIEDLSNSVKALSTNILHTTNSLNKLNASYHRFVPQRFLEILGESHIENVGKKSQAYKENVTMLFLRFKFLSSIGEKSEEIFSNINAVFESVVPVVIESSGTVYNFMPDGFNAVFECSEEEVLRAALKIREVLSALNQQRKRTGQGEVDIRIFISKGSIMLGFIGDEKRMEPAAISKEAQKAGAMHQICFASDIYIACTREVLNQLPKDVYRSRRIGEIMIEEEKVEFFDLFDSDPYTLLKTKEVHADRFELGVNLFMKGDYANARNMFMDIIKYSSMDGAARNYMYVSEHNLRSENKQNTYTTIQRLERAR